MKKIISTLFGLAILASCNTTQTASNTSTPSYETKENLTKSKLNGMWILDDISYDQPDGGQFKVEALGEGDPTCMLNSQWKLISNNNTGFYTLNGNSGCAAGTKNIVWSIVNEPYSDTFKYKIIDSGMKAKNVTYGYSMTIESIDANQMTLRSRNKVNNENKTFDILYHFSKQVKTK